MELIAIAIFVGVTLAAIAGTWVAIKKSWNTVEPEPEELFLEPLEPREESEAARELMYEMKNERTFREPPRPRPLTSEEKMVIQGLEGEIERMTQEYKFDSETLKEAAALLSQRYVTNETRRLIIRNLEYQVKLGAVERREVDRQ